LTQGGLEVFTSSANFQVPDDGKPSSRKRGGSFDPKGRKSWAEMEVERKPRLRSRSEDEDFDDDLDDDDLDDDDDDLDWDDEEDDGDWDGDDYKDEDV